MLYTELLQRVCRPATEQSCFRRYRGNRTGVRLLRKPDRYSGTAATDFAMCRDGLGEVETAEKETATECMPSPCVRGEPASNTSGRSLVGETRYRLFKQELGKV